MSKALTIVLLLLATSSVFGQVIGSVDKKTKQLTILPDQKVDYRVYGYQYANVSTQKMICFSSHDADVRDNYARCTLGSYFDTDKLKPGDKIFYLGVTGIFGKMNLVSGSGKKVIFYLPKSSFAIK